MDPLFSVIIATKNAAGVLGRCLASIESQTSVNWEILVADGGSTDETLDILAAHGPSLAWRDSTPDRGLYSAWNRAIPHARGRWLLFLGADDRLHDREVLDKVAGRLATAPEDHRLAYGIVEMIDEDGRLVGRNGRPWTETKAAFLQEMNLPHSATFHRRDLFDEVGLFDESIRIGGDYEFLLRELVFHDPHFLEDLVVTVMGARGMSQDPRYHGLAVREYYAARRRHGVESRPEWRSYSLWRARGKSWIRRRLGPKPARLGIRAYRLLMGRPFDRRP